MGCGGGGGAPRSPAAPSALAKVVSDKGADDGCADECAACRGGPRRSRSSFCSSLRCPLSHRPPTTDHRAPRRIFARDCSRLGHGLDRRPGASNITPIHPVRRGPSVGVPPEEAESSAEPRSRSAHISRTPIPRRFRPTRPVRQLTVVPLIHHFEKRPCKNPP